MSQPDKLSEFLVDRLEEIGLETQSLKGWLDVSKIRRRYLLGSRTRTLTRNKFQLSSLKSSPQPGDLVDPFFAYATMEVESHRALARLPRYGDEFEALTVGHHELRFVKLVKRARLKRFEFLISQATAASPQFARVISQVEHLNGYWERIFGGIVIIYVPRSSGYDPVKALNRELESSGHLPSGKG